MHGGERAQRRRERHHHLDEGRVVQTEHEGARTLEALERRVVADLRRRVSSKRPLGERAAEATQPASVQRREVTARPPIHSTSAPIKSCAPYH